MLVAVAFGAWAQDLFPGEGTPPNVGLPAVEAWLLAGVIYALLAGLVGRGDRSANHARLQHSEPCSETPEARR